MLQARERFACMHVCVCVCVLFGRKQDEDTKFENSVQTYSTCTEIWAIKESKVAHFERFQESMNCGQLEDMFETHSHISNTTKRQKAQNQPLVKQLIRTRRLRCFGRVYHITPFIPSKILSTQLPYDKRPHGTWLLTWHEILRLDFEELFIKEAWHDLLSSHKVCKSINKSTCYANLRHGKRGHPNKP